MKKRLIALMLLLTMLMTGCVARANETESQSQKQTAEPMEVVEEVVSNAFADVPEDSFYFNAVNWAVENGITNGLTDTTFGPDAECNRAQVVTFLWRLAGKPAASGESSFTDVPAGEWYADAVLWAVEKGITNGLTDTTFGPNEKCNRAQIVTFLYRYAQSMDEEPVDPQPTEPQPTEPAPTEPEPPVTPPTEDPNMGEWA